MAESQGFEPRDPVKGQRFSRPPHSTALPTLRRLRLNKFELVLYQKGLILSMAAKTLIYNFWLYTISFLGQMVYDIQMDNIMVKLKWCNRMRKWNHETLCNPV
jgi:hypothetical protein